MREDITFVTAYASVLRAGILIQCSYFSLLPVHPTVEVVWLAAEPELYPPSSKGYIYSLN